MGLIPWTACRVCGYPVDAARGVHDVCREPSDAPANDTMRMGIEVANILASVQTDRGKHFTMKVWSRAEQIARDAGRDTLSVDDMKAALLELL